MFQTKTECVWPWLCSAYPGPSASRHYLHIRKYIKWSIRMPCVFRWPDMIKITTGPFQSVDISSLIKSIVKEWAYATAWMTVALFLKAKVKVHKEPSEVTPSIYCLPLQFLQAFFLYLTYTVTLSAWGLVTKAAKKRTEKAWCDSPHKWNKKKKILRHPPPSIKRNSPTNLEKAKQTKSCHRKGS